MLLELSVNNYALVDNLRVEFTKGFNVLTGETGAGKSILVDALGTVLGERTNSEVVRSDAEKCRVEAVFDVSDCKDAALKATDFGIEPEDGILILSREITRNGKSTCRINGQTTTAGILKQITQNLVDIHGQHEHQSLLSASAHMDIYDTWLGSDIWNLRSQAWDIHSELSRISAEKNRLQASARERERQIDLLSFQVDEIDSSKLITGEEEELLLAKTRLASAEKLMNGSEEIYQILSGENAVIDNLQNALIACEKLASIDPSIESAVKSLNDAVLGSQDAASFIRDYRDEIDMDPSALEDVENRLHLLVQLKRKYGDSIEEILKFRNEAAVKLEQYQHADEISAEIDSKIEKLSDSLRTISDNIHKIRISRKKIFETNIEKHLSDLAMSGTKFEVSIEPTVPGPAGADEVEFLISANPGEPVKPLSRIASGGEMSRVMLAIKNVCADSGIPTMVFDEIDTGIGGVTASILGEKIANLGEMRQVLCVTHLPQVASKAGNHLRVSKMVDDGRTLVKIDQLNEDDRITELARMLGSGDKSDTAIMHAREMLEIADKKHRKIG